MLIKHSQRTNTCNRCGVRAFYWMHDTDTPGFRYCNNGSDDCKAQHLEGTRVSWVLCDVNGNPHRCGKGSEVTRAPDPTEVTELEEIIEARTSEVPSTLPERVPVSSSPSADSEAVADLLRSLQRLVGTSVDAEQVRTIVKDQIADLVYPTTIIVDNRVTGEVKELEGAVHKVFPDIMTILQGGDNVWMTGSAGSGKTKLAHQCAEALGVSFGSISLTVTTPVSEIVGYRDANGIYHDTAFRRVFEGGGIFLFDEVDNGNPNTLGKVNEALSNGSMEFPDKRVDKHPQCWVMAAANTYGDGPDRTYVGRLQIDFATKDRFAMISVPVDEALEDQVARAQGADVLDVEWLLREVRKLRSKADELNMPVTFSPRASIFGAKLLAAGMSREKVVEVRIRKGVSDTDWRRLNG